MTDWTFKPEVQARTVMQVPYIEDARADYAPYYKSTLSLIRAIASVTGELGKLSAGVLEFERGLYTVNKQERHGYNIRFLHGNTQGVIRIAGLPIRIYSARKENQVRVQCLLVVRDWLKSSVTTQVFNPDMQPLLPLLLMPDGKTTIAQYITSGQLSLPANIVLEGEPA